MVSDHRKVANTKAEKERKNEMKMRDNETNSKYYAVRVNCSGFIAKLTPCANRKQCNIVIIENELNEVIFTAVKRNSLTICEIISTWAANKYHTIKKFSIYEV